MIEFIWRHLQVKKIRTGAGDSGHFKHELTLGIKTEMIVLANSAKSVCALKRLEKFYLMKHRINDDMYNILR